MFTIFKYNMNNIAASLGLSQLKKLDRINSNKTNLIKRYLQTVNNLSYAKPLLHYSLIDESQFKSSMLLVCYQ